jgi:hypothetical protein
MTKRRQFYHPPVDPRDERIKRLEEELWDVRDDIVRLMPDNISDLLSGYYSLETRSDYYRWRRETIDAIVGMTEPDPKASNPYEDRARCPLCKASGDVYGSGFKLPLGLERHLEGWGNVSQCPVTKAAFRNASFSRRDKFDKAEEAEREALELRKITERVLLIDPAENPVLFDERLWSRKPRNPEQLAAAEQWLRDLGFEIETDGNVVAYKFVYAPVSAAFYDDTAPEHLQYYGEMAVHFKGGGGPLLLSISEEVHSGLFRELQSGHKFVTAKSLANQTVVIRIAAISDLYFSSEAYDDFGPEHGTYEHVSLQLPDPRDWEIIESLESMGDVLNEKFDPAAVQRIERVLETTTDEEFRRLVNEGHINSEDVEKARAKESAAANRVFELARNVVYQLSTGQKRHISVYDDADVYGGFWEMVENFDDDDDDHIIVFQAEGYHRTAFINKNALDYISIPTHKYEAGELESNEEEIEFFGDDDRRPPKSKSEGRRKKDENVLAMSDHRK